MSRERDLEQARRVLVNEAGAVSAYLQAKHWYLRGHMSKTMLLEALREAGPYLAYAEDEIEELQQEERRRAEAIALRKARRVAPPRAEPPCVPPSRGPSVGPYR